MDLEAGEGHRVRPFATLAAFFAAVLAGRFAFAAFFAVRFLVAMVCSWVKGPQRPRLDRASPPCLEAGLATRALRWGSGDSRWSVCLGRSDEAEPPSRRQKRKRPDER